MSTDAPSRCTAHSPTAARAGHAVRRLWFGECALCCSTCAADTSYFDTQVVRSATQHRPAACARVAPATPPDSPFFFSDRTQFVFSFEAAATCNANAQRLTACARTNQSGTIRHGACVGDCWGVGAGGGRLGGAARRNAASARRRSLVSSASRSHHTCAIHHIALPVCGRAALRFWADS